MATARKTTTSSSSDGVSPLHLSSKKLPAQFTEREPLFDIDGSVHTIPKQFSASTLLAYNNMIREHGSSVAMAWLVEHALGPDGYAALIDYPGLTDEHLAFVVNACVDRLRESGPKAQSSD